MKRDQFVGDQLLWDYHKHLTDPLHRKQGRGGRQVHQVAVPRFLNLIEAVTPSRADLPHANGNVKTVEVLAEFFGQLGRTV